MSHLGQRLSALIDSELSDFERDRVLAHLAGCDECRDEAIALRALKQRIHALGETMADTALTGRQNKVIFFAADGELTYDKVATFMDMCRDAGAQNLGIVFDDLRPAPVATSR